jgi:thiol peroxidase
MLVKMTKTIVVSWLIFGLSLFALSNESLLGDGQRVHFDGCDLALAGMNLSVGSQFPSVDMKNDCMQSVNTHQLSECYKVILVVPKLGTPSCDAQIKALSDFLDKVEADCNDSFYVVSHDTTEEQVRYRINYSINPNLGFLSANDTDFGEKTGTQIKDFTLLTRAIFIVDPDNIIQQVIRLPNLSQWENVGEEYLSFFIAQTLP